MHIYCRYGRSTRQKQKIAYLTSFPSSHPRPRSPQPSIACAFSTSPFLYSFPIPNLLICPISTPEVYQAFSTHFHDTPLSVSLSTKPSLSLQVQTTNSTYSKYPAVTL